jgi:MFS family permease
MQNARAFKLLLLGQFISLIGTDISKFALRIWAYEQSHSVSQYAFLTFLTEGISLLVSPFAGVFVDRFNRKLILIGSDFAAFLSTFSLLIPTWLHGSNSVTLW